MADRTLPDRVLGLLEEDRPVSAALAIAEAVEKLGSDLRGTLEATLGLAMVHTKTVDRVLALEAALAPDDEEARPDDDHVVTWGCADCGRTFTLLDDLRAHRLADHGTDR
jgi:hypothetical protein